MSVLPVLPAQDPLLRRIASRIRRMDKSLQCLLDDMVESMDAAQGVGLSGPQVGKPLRLIVARVDNVLLQIANPEIVRSKGEEIGDEGCLSLPVYYGSVSRASQITIQGLDRNGKHFRRKVVGLLARVIQHEIDHLEGILFIDHLSKLKKSMIVKKLSKQKKTIERIVV